MKKLLAVLFTYAFAHISPAAHAFDVRYKNQYLREDSIREALRKNLGVELRELTIGGAKLTVTSDGHVYGRRKAECTLMPIQNGRKHVAINCTNDFGGMEAKHLEGGIFDLKALPDGELIYAEWNIYSEARKLVKKRIRSARVTAAPIPIAVIANAECSLDIVKENLELDPCLSEQGLPIHLDNQLVPGIDWGFTKFAPVK